MDCSSLMGFVIDWFALVVGFVFCDWLWAIH